MMMRKRVIGIIEASNVQMLILTKNNFFLQNVNTDWTGFEALMEKQLDGHLLGIIHERNNSKLPQIFRRDFATTLLLDIIQA